MVKVEFVLKVLDLTTKVMKMSTNLALSKFPNQNYGVIRASNFTLKTLDLGTPEVSITKNGNVTTAQVSYKFATIGIQAIMGSVFFEDALKSFTVEDVILNFNLTIG